MPGVHVTGETLAAGSQDWYEVQLLRPASIEFGLAFDPSQGVLNLTVLDSQQIRLPRESRVPRALRLPCPCSAGTYYIEVTGQSPATSNAYDVSADFQDPSDGTVYYVNSGNMVGDCYTLAPGNDANDGLTPATPKATVQSVLDTYTLGPNSLIVVDTGTYNAAITLDSSDQGVVLAGSPGGSVMSNGGTALQLNDADQNIIYDLQFSGNSTGIDSQASGTNTLTGNTIENDTFQTDSCTIPLNNGGNDTIEGNSITGGSYGICLSGWSGGETISGNTISGTGTAISASTGSAQATLLIGGSSPDQGNLLAAAAREFTSRAVRR